MLPLLSLCPLAEKNPTLHSGKHPNPNPQKEKRKKQSENQKQVARKRLLTSMQTTKKEPTTHQVLITPLASAPLESSPLRPDLPSHCKRRVFPLNHHRESRNPKRKKKPLNLPLPETISPRKLRRPPCELCRCKVNLLKNRFPIRPKLPHNEPASTSLPSPQSPAPTCNPKA